jgi:CubicO group peptidase (beta-lactamase class C family)
MSRRTLSAILAPVLIALSSSASGDSPERAPTIEASPAVSAEERAEQTIAELEESIPDLMEKARIPGLQIALIRRGEVIWRGAYGVTNTAGGAVVTRDTIFEAASLTKPLFAYVVMQMVDKKLIDLDTPLLEAVPKERAEELIGHSLDTEGFRLDWAKKITARHVLSHSAGMPHGDGGEIYPIFFEPGTDWKYSAQGYQFLQMVVEGIEGKPLEEIVDAYVLDPLGMGHSSMVWRESYEKPMANGHWLYGRPEEIRKRSRATAAASLYTTAGDYARFVCAVLDGSRLKPETHKEMLASFVDMNDEGTLGWGLGFGTQVEGDRTAFWQWGDYGIFRNYVIADPEQRSGVVYLTNSFNGLAVCSELVMKSIGQDALGCLELNYMQYDSPALALLWDLKEKGPQAATKQLPSLVKEYPDVFTDDRVNGLAGIMENEEMYAEAAAIYRFIADQHPRSGDALFDLARVSVLMGDLDKAKKLYTASLSAPEDPPGENQVDWALDYIKALEDPAQIDESTLKKIAGGYGPRHIFVKDGSLFYSREDADTSKPRPLKAVTQDTFVIEGVTYFKLQVVFDEEGNPTKLVGIYETGQRDESPRDQ